MKVLRVLSCTSRMTPWPVVREMFDLYRAHYVDNGLPGGLAFMPLVSVADTDEEAMRNAERRAGC